MVLLLDNGADVNAMGGEYGNALQAASFIGDEVIVDVLFKNWCNYQNALGAIEALYQSNAVIVKMLLENGAKVNVEGGRFGYALHAALFRGAEVIVKLLLENGAEVNGEGKYGNALQASCKGYDAIMKLLLEIVGEIDEGITEEYIYSLQVVFLALHEAIIKFLLKNGVEVNAALLNVNFNPAFQKLLTDALL